MGTRKKEGKKAELTIREFARLGGKAVVKKYGRAQMKRWGKLGGRPPGKKRKKG